MTKQSQTGTSVEDQIEHFRDHINVKIQSSSGAQTISRIATLVLLIRFHLRIASPL
jgi:hypothetical protein